MSTTAAILEKVSALPPEKQAEVLRYVKSFAQPVAQRRTEGDPYAWFRIASEMNLDGSADWSERFED